jgi:hypothetical protein
LNTLPGSQVSTEWWFLRQYNQAKPLEHVLIDCFCLALVKVWTGSEDISMGQTYMWTNGNSLGIKEPKRRIVQNACANKCSVPLRSLTWCSFGTLIIHGLIWRIRKIWSFGGLQRL